MPGMDALLDSSDLCCNRGVLAGKNIEVVQAKKARLEQIPGVGPLVAAALVSEVGDWKEFSS